MNSSPTLGRRDLFPHLEFQAYLSHCSVSPLSTPVLQAMERAHLGAAQRGQDALYEWLATEQALKQALARLLGTSASQLALITNVTSAVQAVSHAVRWKAGERILLFRGEFPTNVLPWVKAAEIYDLEVTFMATDDFRQAQALEKLERRLRSGVRLVAVSAVQFQTGLRMPIEEIAELCRSYDTLLFVDGIQTLGVVPFSVEGIDFVAGGSHKWMMGPLGAGFLYLAPERVQDLEPRLVGWLSHQDPIDFLEHPDLLEYDKPLRKEASVFECGSRNHPGYAGLLAATEILLELGVERIFAHVSGYLDLLEEKALESGYPSVRSPVASGKSGILSLGPFAGERAAQVVEALKQAGIRAGCPDGYVRFGPHFCNSYDEIDRVAEVLRDLSG